MQLNLQQVAHACGTRLDIAVPHVDALNQVMEAFDISTPARAGMFLANIGHETAGLRHLSEIWGPIPAQLRYERDFTAPWPRTPDEARLEAFARNRLAYGLGNAQKGDGERFRGHGYLQNTGRYNHARARDRLRERFPDLEVPDFEAEPEQLATPTWAALAAGEYVERHRLNEVADAGDFDGYCDVINRGHKTAAEGDSNGFAQRLALWRGIDEGRALV